MQRHSALRWFGSLPLASALAAAVVVGLSALVETTRLALPAVALRPLSQPSPPVLPRLNSGSAPRAVMHTHCLPVGREPSVELPHRAAVEHRSGGQAGRRTALRFKADGQHWNIVQRLPGFVGQRDARDPGWSDGRHES
jgi:hypothetical protein